MKNDNTLKKWAERRAKIIIQMRPTTEHELLKALKNNYNGYHIKRGKYAKVYAEIWSDTKIGVVNFSVPSCTKFYKRDKKGYIINLEYFEK